MLRGERRTPDVQETGTTVRKKGDLPARESAEAGALLGGYAAHLPWVQAR